MDRTFKSNSSTGAVGMEACDVKTKYVSNNTTFDKVHVRGEVGVLGVINGDGLVCQIR